MLKKAAKRFLRWNVVDPVVQLHNELIFQKLFDNQCRTLRIDNEFYPLGGAANHGIMYLLTRLLTDEKILDIVEFGSGQSTLLIDRIRPKNGSHLALEADIEWHQRIEAKLHRCEYLYAPLEERTIASITTDTYPSTPRPFDLILVDGPRGVARHSRFGCVEWIDQNPRESFIIILDDTNRIGEQETVACISKVLKNHGRPHRTREMQGRTIQTVFAVGAMQHIVHYW